MPEYKCICCDFSSKLKGDYNRHLKTKKHIRLAEISLNLAEISPKLAEISHENKDYMCKYCDKVFKHHSSLCKHIKYTCKKNKDEDLKELVKLMNEKLDDSVNEIKMMKKEIAKRDRQITKLSKKLQINNGNIITNNYNNNNIQLLNYKDTDISHLTKEDYANSIKRINNCVKTITEKIHYNPEKPENMNIYISNLKNDYVTVYENGRWELRKDFENIYEHKEILLEEWIGKEENNYPELRDKFEKYLNNKENDNILNTIKKDIKLMMYNNRSNVVCKMKDIDTK